MCCASEVDMIILSYGNNNVSPEMYAMIKISYRDKNFSSLLAKQSLIFLEIYNLSRLEFPYFL